MAADLWEITDHVCRVCFGRVLRDAAHTRYRCACCGAEAEGRSPSVVCACGSKYRTGKDMGVRCIANDAPRPEFPSQIVAAQLGGGGPN